MEYIEVRPQPGPQEAFLRAAEDEVLYGGAKGGGKSFALIMESIRNINHSGYRGIIFRRTYPALEELIARSKQFFPGLYGKWNGSSHTWTFQNGAIVKFGHCQHESDVYIYQGHEYHFMGFDQLEEFTESQYLFLMAQQRSTVKGLVPYTRGTANPGGIGHAWVYKRFMTDGHGKKIKPGTVQKEEFTLPFKIKGLNLPDKIVRRRKFIPATVYDNKILLNNDPRYLGTLMQLPEKLRQALLDGNWNVFSGQYFDQWDEEIHVIEPIKIEKRWKKFRCMDYGSTNPFACYWGAVDEKGTVYIYREHYASGYTARESANTVMDMSPSDEEYFFDVIDSAIWNNDGRDTTVFDEMDDEARKRKKAGLKNALRLEPASKNRIGGWNVVKEYLRHNESKGMKPRVYVFSDCYNLIRTVPAMIHDDKKVEDLNTDGEDHAVDALRYGLVRINGGFTKPLEPEKPKLRFGIPATSWKPEILRPWDLLG